MAEKQSQAEDVNTPAPTREEQVAQQREISARLAMGDARLYAELGKLLKRR